MTNTIDKRCPTCAGKGYMYIGGVQAFVECPNCVGTGQNGLETNFIQRCLGGHPVTNALMQPWRCSQPDCPYFYPPIKKQKSVDMVKDPLPWRQLLHKWLGAKSAYFQTKLDRETLWELLETIERRRG